MGQLMLNWLDTARMVGMAAAGTMIVINVVLRAFHWRSGSLAAGFGALIGGVAILAGLALIPWLTTKAQSDYTGGGITPATAPPAAGVAGN